MLAFNHLGQLGRFGNQMFQYASLKGIARNRGMNYCIPNNLDSIEIFLPFKLETLKPENIGLLDNGYAPVAEEKHFHFDEIFFNMCPDEISICGFFQSEKYFKHIEDEIRLDFCFKNEILEPCKEMYSSIGEAISLHVRRGDYLENINHTTLDLDYYQTAIEIFNNDMPVIIFSDDVEWCKEQKIFSGDRFLISESGSNYIDMCLMSLCEKHIIANSSFSWWGAWLSNSNDVIAPIKWFGEGNIHKETKDLIPERWKRI